MNRRRISWSRSFVVWFGIVLASCGGEKAPRTSTAADSVALGEDAELVAVEGYPADVIDALDQRTKWLIATSQALLSPEDHPEFQSVLSLSRLWQSGQTLTVAFRGGTPQLRRQVAEGLRPWTNAINLVLDFGPDAASGTYREWTDQDRQYAADIRISFDRVGYWSFVGSDATDPQLAKPNRASMNFQGFDRRLPPDWQSTVLHEFGHAFGFEHEHQSPLGPCEEEFRWEDDPGYLPTTDSFDQFIIDAQGRRPGIYRVLGGPPNHWSRSTVEQNLRRLPFSVDVISSIFDASSIMKYYFPAWMFRSGSGSRCFSARNDVLSAEDLRAATENYPRAADQALVVIASRKRQLDKALLGLDWTKAQRDRLSGHLQEIARQRASQSSEP